MVTLQIVKSDVLVVGAGLAGMRAAMAAQQRGAAVMVIAKGPAASPGVIGFNAPVGAKDSERIYFEDTWRGGMYLGDPALVRLLAERTEAAVEEMKVLGVQFDQVDGSYHLLRPLGCRCPRLVHQRNRTGQISLRLMRATLEANGAIFHEGTVVLELLKSKGAVNGVLAVDTRADALLLIQAGAVVLAAGGGGGMYSDGTYPRRLVGDGYALAYRAGAELVDMEFVQFEPCHCLFPKRLGLSTTLLSHGGVLKNSLGQRFVLRDYPGGEGEAPKDALARLIALEVAGGRGSAHGGVFCDLGRVPKKIIVEDHSAYYRLFLRNGVDLCRDVFEVGPAAHTFLGGVAIDTHCRSTVKGLFAAGEAVGGLHGANRIGGNAGSECFVFGAVAGINAARWQEKHGMPLETRAKRAAKTLATSLNPGPKQRSWDATATVVRKLMSDHVGAIRNGAMLERALSELRLMESGVTALDAKTPADVVARNEILNMVQAGALVAEGARRRQESRGVHYREDYPERDDALWQKSLCFSQARGRQRVALKNRSLEGTA